MKKKLLFIFLLIRLNPLYSINLDVYHVLTDKTSSSTGRNGTISLINIDLSVEIPNGLNNIYDNFWTESFQFQPDNSNANICSNDTLVSTVNLPTISNVRATTYYSNIFLFNQNNTSNAFKYIVNDRKYTAIADKPTACIECGVAEANGKVYCFNTNGTTQAYDIASNTWQNQANQTSTSTSSVYAASINNKIYVLGTNNNQNTFTQYNPQTNSYLALTNPTTNSSQSRLVAFNNKLYKIGGTDNNSQPTSSVEVYNPTNNTWTAMPDLPVALTQVGATYYDNKLYVFGGKQASNTNSNKVYVFDFTSNAWYAESNTQNTNRTNIEAKTANNMVFLFGGADTTNTQTNQAQRYFCKDQLCTCKWAEYVCNGVSSDVPCPTSSLYRPGTVFCNGYATKVVEVTNPITGKTWMDRNLGAQRAALNFDDSLAYGDLYQWGRGADGHQCRNSATTTVLSSTDKPNNNKFIISPLNFSDWRSPQNNNLWQRENGINNPCPYGFRIPNYNDLDVERSSWSQNNSLGAFNSTLKLPTSDIRQAPDGFPSGHEYGGYWSSNTDGNYSQNLFLSDVYGISKMQNSIRGNAYSVRCIKDYIFKIDTVGSINNGVLKAGTIASNVSTTIFYKNASGQEYIFQSDFPSSGVSGLTASLVPGSLNYYNGLQDGSINYGNGSITFAITGTPNSSGNAIFTVIVGDTTFSFIRNVSVSASSVFPVNTVFCNGSPTAVVEVTNPVTGKTWMDRNLGAQRVATSSIDSLAYGDLYQWGRKADGHQCRNSGTTVNLSSIDQPNHGNFIVVSVSPNDWRSPQNDNLWQGVNGINNPCPSGFRIPTDIELESEKYSWSQNTSAGAFNSPLKLTMAGNRLYSGFINTLGTGGRYWSSTVYGTRSTYLSFNTSNSIIAYYYRAIGYSVRCIKD